MTFWGISKLITAKTDKYPDCTKILVEIAELLCEI